MRARLAVLLIITSLITVLVPRRAPAQELITNACLTETYDRLGSEQRRLRSTVLGQRTASELPIGAIRYDRAHRAWRKKAPNSWNSLAGGFSTTTWSDLLIDREAEFPARRGILEARRTTTSDLLPSLLQAFRAFQCRTRATCAASQDSLRRDAPAQILVQPIGCIEFRIPRFDGCRIEQPAGGGATEPPIGANLGEATLGYCEGVRTQLVEHEARLLTLLVAYDASYRSLLQFAGTFEDFVQAFREPLLLPFLQAVRVLRTFADIPCFTAQCDE